MDAFKVAEISRMDKGGNNAWKTFFNNHAITKLHAVSWDECTIGERYGGEVGEEWKDRLTALIEGREYAPEPKKDRQSRPREGRSPEDKLSEATGSQSEMSPGKAGAETSLRSSSPAISSLGSTKKAENEAYFARLGTQNASRSTTVPPNQGGKYTGFGSDLSSAREGDGSEKASIPGIDEFQKDPVAALTKGFGWFSTAVGKGAKTVNDGWIQPAAQKVWYCT